MKRKVLPFNGPQFSRRSRLDRAECRHEIEAHYASINFWGYWYAREAIFGLLSGATPAAILAGCDRLKSKKSDRRANTGYTQNLEVLTLAAAIVAPVVSMVHSPKKQLMPIRADSGLWVAPRGFYVRDEKVVMFWCQPCRNFGEDLTPFRIYNALLHDRFVATGFFESMTTEVYDFQADPTTNIRMSRIITDADAPKLERSELLERLAVFTEVHDQMIAEGIEKKIPQKIIRPSAERGLFD